MGTVFSGGEALEAKLKEIIQRVGQPKGVRVGVLEGATYPDEENTPVAMVAAIQEFGAPNVGIPPRPFFRTTVEKHKGHWPEDLGKIAVATDYDIDRTLGLMGTMIKEEIQDAIRETMEPALSPVTVMLRGMRSNNSDLKINGTTVAEARARVDQGLTNYGASSKPLIDTGHLLNSIEYEIKSGDGS
jgi:hypothetical protein